jgi:hypothetical protein
MTVDKQEYPSSENHVVIRICPGLRKAYIQLEVQGLLGVKPA